MEKIIIPISERKYLNYREAIAYVGKSESFFKRKVAFYKIGKTAITKQYKKEDLDKLISGEILLEKIA